MKDLDQIIAEAVDLLEGRVDLPGLVEHGDRDAARDRLLAGFRHILVDEYQDIDDTQYRLIAAIAGRSQQANGDDSGLTLLAVGDDDQNIYAFRGTNIDYIRRFRTDYAAELHELVENYRSSAHIIAAANALIAHNRDRMKTDRPIRIDRHREQQPAGGRFSRLDGFSRGRVLMLKTADAGCQAAALVERIREIRHISGDDWSEFAVLARTHETLAPVRALCEAGGVPVAVTGDMPSLHRIREIDAFLNALRERGRAPCSANDLEALLNASARLPQVTGFLEPADSERPSPQGAGLVGTRRMNLVCQETKSSLGLQRSDAAAEVGPKPYSRHVTIWCKLLERLIADWRAEIGNHRRPAIEIAEFVYETLADQRRERRLGEGVLLTTLHGAKGLEFPHVLILDGGLDGGLDGDWRRDRDPVALAAIEEERRLFYVGMTRAKETLTLGALAGSGHPHLPQIDTGDWLLQAEPKIGSPPAEIVNRRYQRLSPADLDLGYAGRHPPGALIHAWLAALTSGDQLGWRRDGNALTLLDPNARPVGRLSRRAAAVWLPRVERIEAIRVDAMLRQSGRHSTPEYAERCRCEHWEVPLVEIQWQVG